ncbi:ribosome assembly RNA-binding protein YhbY [Barrientosiimonas marina]|uniref:Ribosome assembly RNA-binding protein YhbY n=1 Tax=Lentibacillus kimchii TaxID=1542911 RepID=A0ABW2UW06_9BACI
MLTGKQKRYLRSQANSLKPVFQVGKTGVNANMADQISEALERRELVKVSVLQNCPEDKNTAAEKLADRSGSYVVQVIGHTIVLYKESDEHKQIVLPKSNG